MRLAAAVPLLVLFMWAAWPDVDAYPDLDPLDAEALRLLRDLERGRAGAWERLVRARNPRTVPALMVRESEETLDALLHRPEMKWGDPAVMLPPRTFCCDSPHWQRQHPPADAFESALQAALGEGDHWEGLRRRDIGGARSLGQFELEERLADPEPGVRFAAAFQLWKSGAMRTIPEALGTLGEHSFVRYPWLESVATVMRRESADASIHEGVNEGHPRALAVAAFLKRKASVDEIVQQLNDAARKREWPGLAWTLGEIGDPRGVEPLTRVLRQSDAWLARVAAEALGKIGEGSAEPALRAALADAGRLNRLAIERALDKLRP